MKLRATLAAGCRREACELIDGMASAKGPEQPLAFQTVRCQVHRNPNRSLHNSLCRYYVLVAGIIAPILAFANAYGAGVSNPALHEWLGCAHTAPLSLCLCCRCAARPPQSMNHASPLLPCSPCPCAAHRLEHGFPLRQVHVFPASVPDCLAYHMLPCGQAGHLCFHSPPAVSAPRPCFSRINTCTLSGTLQASWPSSFLRPGRAWRRAASSRDWPCVAWFSPPCLRPLTSCRTSGRGERAGWLAGCMSGWWLDYIGRQAEVLKHSG